MRRRRRCDAAQGGIAALNSATTTGAATPPKSVQAPAHPATAATVPASVLATTREVGRGAVGGALGFEDTSRLSADEASPSGVASSQMPSAPAPMNSTPVTSA